jgi:carbonic anhydrase
MHTEHEIAFLDDGENAEALKAELLKRNAAWVETVGDLRDGSAAGYTGVNGSMRTAVVACMDSRDPVEAMFGTHVGEMFVLRNAGNIISDDVVRGLLVAILEAGVKYVIVLGHSRCGMAQGDNPEKVAHFMKRLGPGFPLGPEWFGFFAAGQWDENALAQAEALRQRLAAWLPEESVPTVIPASYNIDDGRVEFL